MAKNNNKWKVISIPIGLVGLLLGIIWYAATIASSVERNTDSIERIHPVTETNRERITSNREKVIKVESDVDHMTKKLDDFIQEQRAVNTQVLEYLRTSNN